MARVIIQGAGPVAALAHAYLGSVPAHEVVAFTGPGMGAASQEPAGLPRVAFADLAASFPPQGHAMFIAPGSLAEWDDRPEALERARAAGYELISYVHPSASIWPGTTIGHNSFILERVVVQPWASLGADVTIWSGSHVGHETVIGDHCFLSAATVVSGNVTIEPLCHIGPNASIRNAITLARGTRVGPNVTLRASTQAGAAYGSLPTYSSGAD